MISLLSSNEMVTCFSICSTGTSLAMATGASTCLLRRVTSWVVRLRSSRRKPVGFSVLIS
jgi:hypothetical protein